MLDLHNLPIGTIVCETYGRPQPVMTWLDCLRIERQISKTEYDVARIGNNGMVCWTCAAASLRVENGLLFYGLGSKNACVVLTPEEFASLGFEESLRELNETP